MGKTSLADTLRRVLESPNVPDGNLEPANLVDGLAMARAVEKAADDQLLLVPLGGRLIPVPPNPERNAHGPH